MKLAPFIMDYFTTTTNGNSPAQNATTAAIATKEKYHVAENNILRNYYLQLMSNLIESVKQCRGSVSNVAKKIAAIHQVKAPALIRAYHRHSDQLKHGNSTLSEVEEMALVMNIVAMAAQATPYTPGDLIALIRDSWNKKVDHRWLHRFRKKYHKYITFGQMKRLSNQRDPEKVERATRAFIGKHKKFMATHSIPPKAIFNYDESRIGQQQGTKSVRNYLMGKGASGNVAANRGCETSSIVPFVSATGRVLCIFYILPIKGQVNKGKAMPDVTFQFSKKPAQFLRSGFKEYVMYTDTGFVNQETFGETHRPNLSGFKLLVLGQ